MTSTSKAFPVTLLLVESMKDLSPCYCPAGTLLEVSMICLSLFHLSKDTVKELASLIHFGSQIPVGSPTSSLFIQ